MPTLEKVDIAIVGGGMVGLSLAKMLAHQQVGKRILLIESYPVKVGKSAPPSSFDSRSTAVAAGSVKLLEQLGLWQQTLPYATAINKVIVSDKGHIGWTDYSRSKQTQHIAKDSVNTDKVDAQAKQKEALGFVVENSGLGHVLVNAVSDCESVEVCAPAKLSSLTPVANAMRIAIESEQSGKRNIEAQLVVLADGADSPLAKRLGIRFDRHDYQQQALIANVEHSEAHHGRAFERFTEAGPLALLPTSDLNGKHRSALVWTHAKTQIDQVLKCSDKELLARLQSQFGHALGRFSGISQRHAYSLNLLFAQEQVRSSLVLMGNAAHFLHPVAGQGFNLALRDCAELTRQLLHAQTHASALGNISVLQNYLERRKRDQWLTTELSHNFIQMFTSTHPAKRVLRNGALTALNTISPVKSLFFAQMMGQAGASVSL